VKKIISVISKVKEKNNFLKSKVIEAIPDLEIDLYHKIKNLNYTIKDILESEENELIRMLQRKRHVKNLFNSLKEEIKKRELVIKLEEYPAFKTFKN
jgi:cell fate regulator YaaT (PSP1 superfamily)